MSCRHTLLVVLLLFCSAASAQTGERIHGSYSRYTFEQFVKDIESKTKYRFYYRASDIDSTTVDLGEKTETIDALLKEIFSTTNLHYAIDPAGNIFITKDIEVVGTLLYEPSTIEGAGTRSVITQLEDFNDKLTVGEDKLIEVGIRTTMTGHAMMTITSSTVA